MAQTTAVGPEERETREVDARQGSEGVLEVAIIDFNEILLVISGPSVARKSSTLPATR